MAVTPFRPSVCVLEARDVPVTGVTPAQVFAAIDFVNATPAVLKYFDDNLDLARAGGAGRAALSASDLNRGAADTLSKFVQDAREVAAANPAAAGTLNELIASSSALVAQANANAIVAEALANRLGTVRPTPPPPPPTGVGDTPIVPNPDQNGTTPVTPTPPTNPVPPADGSQITATLPLLTDPGFTAVGTQGLRVKDVRVGEGAVATSTSSVTVRYRGFLVSNGTSFDNNVGTSSPLSAVLGPTPTVIQGFAQGVAGMKVGGIRDIDIPSELGYGAAGSGTSIPPNSRLVFEVQLVSVV